MAGMTLLEAAKFAPDPLSAGFMELYAKESPILRIMPFTTISGMAHEYIQENGLPTVAFRAVNASYTAASGETSKATEVLSIFGGELDVDNYIVAQGGDARAIHTAMQAKALAYGFTKRVIKGDNTSTPAEFDGLQVRCSTASEDQLDAGATAGGDALSLAKLDELSDMVDDATHWIMNKTMVRLLTAAARTTTVGGQITYTVDQFGRRITEYNSLPILVADVDETYTTILPFTEADLGGGDDLCTSIYCVRFGMDGVFGIQNAPMQVKDLGEISGSPVHRTRVEWFCGMVKPRRAAARLRGIKNATVVV